MWFGWPFPACRHTLNLPHSEVEVPVVLKHSSEGEGDVARFQSCRGHLIDQWWKLVVVVLVHQHHLVVGLSQAQGQPQAAQSASHDDDSPLFVPLDVRSHISVCLSTSHDVVLFDSTTILVPKVMNSFRTAVFSCVLSSVALPQRRRVACRRDGSLSPPFPKLPFQRLEGLLWPCERAAVDGSKGSFHRLKGQLSESRFQVAAVGRTGMAASSAADDTY